MPKAAQWGVSRNGLVWMLAIGLLLLGVGLGLLSTPEMAGHYWFLLSVPIALAAFRFGLRGAAILATLSVLVLVAVFQVTAESLGELTRMLERVVQASASPEEARRLALQLADLRDIEHQTSFARAFAGIVLSVIGGGLLLGASVDQGVRMSRLLQRTVTHLTRYFSPQVIQAILAQAHEAGTGVISERKEITILFADLREFTELSERLETEEVVQLLNEFFSAMTEEIFRQDGTLDKYLGDGLMAFFGDPVWHPDHPERAFRTAIAMQERARELQSLWQAQGRETTGLGIGINTGPAIVGNTGSPSRVEYTAIGSAVNIAARLAELAQAHQILTTRKTYWRVQHLVEGVPLEPARVKGFAQPVEMVEIRGIRLVRREEEAGPNGRLVESIARVVTDSSYRALLLGSGTRRPAVYGLEEEEQELLYHVAVLSGYPIFQDVPPEQIASLLEPGLMERYGEGSIILRQSEFPEHFYIVLQGDVVVTVLDEMKREHHIASLARGDCFGEVALLFDTPRTATVRASSDTVLLVLGKDEFYSVLARAPTLRGKIEGTARSRAGQAMHSRYPDLATVGAAPTSQ